MSPIQDQRENFGIEGNWICVGALGAPHGVRGDVRLKSFTAEAGAVFDFRSLRKGADGPALSVRKVSTTKDGFIVHVEGFESPEAVGALRGVKLFASRGELQDTDEDEYYLADLIGLEARSAQDGSVIGAIHSVENFGADDLLELTLRVPAKGLGRSVYIPFERAFVPEVNIQEGFVTVAFEAWLATQTAAKADDGKEQEA